MLLVHSFIRIVAQYFRLSNCLLAVVVVVVVHDIIQSGRVDILNTLLMPRAFQLKTGSTGCTKQYSAFFIKKIFFLHKDQ